jgi:hypothetical protein
MEDTMCDYKYEGDCEDYDYCEYKAYPKSKVKMTHRWYNLADKKPDNGREIIGLDSGGNERHLKFSRNMFWLLDMSMYVYFTPSKWRYA